MNTKVRDSDIDPPFHIPSEDLNIICLVDIHSSPEGLKLSFALLTFLWLRIFAQLVTITLLHGLRSLHNSL